MFLQIRSKSIGEVIELVVGHRGGNCKHKTEVSVNLNDIKVNGEISDGKLIVDEANSIGVKLRYPSMKDAEAIAKMNETEGVFELLYRCTEMVFDADNVYDDFNEDELIEWYDQLNGAQFELISNFFRDIPKVSYDIEWQCEKCGKEDKIKLEGLRNFFM
jgi:hypothetical protein